MIATLALVPPATTPRRKARKRGAGEGSIYHRSDGLWVARLVVGRHPDGKLDRRTVSAKTRSECQKKLDELRTRAAAGTLTDLATERMTTADFLSRWLEWTRGSIRDTSWERYEGIVRVHLSPALGKAKLADLRPQHLQKLYADKRADGLSPRTVRYIHATLRRALGQAVRWGVVSRNVATLVDPPRLQRAELHPPTNAHVRKLLDTAREHEDQLAPLWTVAVYSGCRLGEILGLQWPDVDLQGGRITIRRTLVATRNLEPVYGEPKTRRSQRTVSLPPEAIEALQTQLAHQAERQAKSGVDYAEYNLVFATRIGTPFRARNVQRDFKLALKRAGLEQSIRFHDLRHFAATLMLGAGVHPKVASERLGHSTVGITLDLYSHVVEGLDVDAAERMQRAIRG